MKVTIIVPVYNSAEYLHESIGALKKQTYNEIEIILVENGSTDNSLDVCNGFAEKDKRITVIHTDENIGTGAARNLGLESATGEYIAFLDADDRYEPQAIEKLVSAATEHEADVVICGYKGFRDDNIKTEPHRFQKAILKNREEVRNYVAKWFPDGRVGFPWNKLYKAEVIRENNLEFPKLSRLEDGFFNLDFFNYTKSCVVIPDILYNYRLPEAESTIKKHNSSYADLVISLTEAAIAVTSSWGFSEPSEEVWKFCLNELGTSIENAFLGGWEQTTAERNEYLKIITENDTYKAALEHLETIGNYRRQLHVLMNKGDYVKLEALIRAKTFGKDKLSWLYYRLKK